jgi:hypothetical protein
MLLGFLSYVSHSKGIRCARDPLNAFRLKVSVRDALPYVSRRPFLKNVQKTQEPLWFSRILPERQIR